MSEFFEAAEEIVEEIFPPTPGGLVDKHRKRVAEEKAKEAERENESEAVEGAAYRAVKVAPQTPEVFSGNVITIQPGAAGMVLPLSLYRYRATIKVLTAASSVVLGKDSGAATGGVGYTLATADPPFVAFARAQLWGFNPGGAVIQVCVLVELYAPEGKEM